MGKKAILIVLDGVGAGNAPDALAYGDEGANTLKHVFEAERPNLPELRKMGLGHIPDVGFAPSPALRGSFGRCRERSAGKDTTTGHWEMAGLITETPFPTFPDGFPKALIEAYEKAIGLGTLGNYASSGTVILDVLGEEHMRTGSPIVYTSADSVFQIAAHEDVISAPELWKLCEIARGILTGPYAVGRVIARPFVGVPGAFSRTGNRRDFSVVPPKDTMLDVLKAAGYQVAGVGKIEDIFAHRGLTESDHAAGNPACIESMLGRLDRPLHGLMFVNLVDFDSVFGHRNDIPGFAAALEAVDRAIAAIVEKMGEDDLLLFTADHGCDPGYPGTDHTREMVPLLAFRPGRAPVDLGVRQTMGDISATILEMFGIENTLAGTSFYQALR